MVDTFTTASSAGDQQTWFRSICGRYITAEETDGCYESRVEKTPDGIFRYQVRARKDHQWSAWRNVRLDHDPEIPAAWDALMGTLTLQTSTIQTSLPEGRKDDADKNRLDLLPFDALEEVAEILTLGARKYNDRNWESGINYNRLFRAALGHLWAWWMRRDEGKGPGNDKETGRTHLAHAACCVLFLLTFELRKMTKFDNRPNHSKPAE